MLLPSLDMSTISDVCWRSYQAGLSCDILSDQHATHIRDHLTTESFYSRKFQFQKVFVTQSFCLAISNQVNMQCTLETNFPQKVFVPESFVSENLVSETLNNRNFCLKRFLYLGKTGKFVSWKGQGLALTVIVTANRPPSLG